VVRSVLGRREIAHPRLFVTVLVGAGCLVLAAVLFLAGGTFGTDLRRAGLRLAILGYVVVALGGAGYLALAIFERLPEQ